MRFGTQEISQWSKHRQRDQAEAKTEEQKQGQTLLSISQGKMLEHFLQRDKDKPAQRTGSTQTIYTREDG